MVEIGLEAGIVVPLAGQEWVGMVGEGIVVGLTG